MFAKKTMTVAALAALVLLPLAGCAGPAPASDEYKLVTPGTLTACADVPFPPFEVEDKSSPSGYSGFDVDLMAAIAKGLGLEFKLIDVDFDALQSGTVLVAGQCDLGASAITITDERKANIDFADPYYDSLQSLLVKADSGIADLAGLAGKNIGVQQGTTGKTYTQENAPKDAKIVDYPSDGELWPALQAGQIDAILQDLPVNQTHEKTDANYKVVATYETDEKYGFAFAKGEKPELLAAINAQLKALRDNGTYQQIYDKYFG